MKVTKRLRPLLATATALVMLLGMLPMTAFAGQTAVLEFETPLSVTATREDPAELTFTPTETGLYVLVSSSDSDPQATLYDAMGEELAYADDNNDYDFRLAYYLTAGEEYTYMVDARDSEEPFTVKLIRGVAATGVDIADAPDGVLTLPLSTHGRQLKVTTKPTNADAPLVWSVEDEDILQVSDNKISLLALGTTTVTVTTGNVSDTITVTVVEPTEELKMGSTDVSFPADTDRAVYKFTPAEDGEYHFLWETHAEEDNSLDCHVEVSDLNSDGQLSDGNCASAYDTVAYDVTLEKGTSYIVTLYSGNEHDDLETTLQVGRTVAATSLSFEEGGALTLVYDIVDGFALTPAFAPAFAKEESVTWSSSNEDVATVDENGYVEVWANGTTTITATSENELTASFTLTVIDPPAIALDTEYSFTASDMVSATKYTFTPEKSDWYVVNFTVSGDYQYSYMTFGEGGSSIGPGANWVYLEEDVTATLAMGTFTGQTMSFIVQEAVDPTSIAFIDEDLTLAVNDTWWLDYELFPANGFAEEVVFTSSDESVVRVNDYGLLYTIAPGTATVTVTIPDGKTDTVTVTVLPPLPWHGEKTEKVMITPLNDVVAYELTVDADGWYEIFAEEGAVLYLAECVEDDVRYVADGDAKYERIVAYLEKDAVYYLNVYGNVYDYKYFLQCSVTLRGCEEPDAELESGVNIRKDTLTAMVGDKISPEYDIAPSEFLVEITSSDESVLSSVEGSCPLAMAPGTATLTYTTNEGNTDTITVTVVENTRTLTKGEEVTVELTGEVYGQAYTFTPAVSGSYVFYSQQGVGANDPQVYLFDSDWNVIGWNDNRGDTDAWDFYLEVLLTEGETYYVTFTSWDWGNFSYTAGVTVPTNATALTVDLEGCLFEIDGVYYVRPKTEVHCNVVPTPAYSWIDNFDAYLTVEGSTEKHNDLYMSTPGEATLTVKARGMEPIELKIRAVELVAGDLNCDGAVDAEDVTLLYEHLSGKTDIGTRALLANMNSDSEINIDDLALLHKAAGLEEIIGIGDADGSGKIDSTDARLVLQYAVKKIPETSLNTLVADVDGSGKVDSTDARLILQYAVKKISTFPIVE